MNDDIPIDPTRLLYSTLPYVLNRHSTETRTKGTYPLDLNALCPVHVVAFTVRGKILGVCRRGWLKVLGILCQLQSFGFLP